MSLNSHDIAFRREFFNNPLILWNFDYAHQHLLLAQGQVIKEKPHHLSIEENPNITTAEKATHFALAVLEFMPFVGHNVAFLEFIAHELLEKSNYHLKESFSSYATLGVVAGVYLLAGIDLLLNSSQSE